MRSLFRKFLTFALFVCFGTPVLWADELDAVRETLEDARRQLRELEIEGFNRAEALVRLGAAIDALKIEIVEDEEASETQPVFERLAEDVAYSRIDATSVELASRVREELSARDSWSGLIVDLRFAKDGDWDGVAAFLQLISAGSAPEFWVGDEVVAVAESDPPALRAPIVILINRETRGAPWALAAIAQSHTLGMIIGESADRGEASSEISIREGESAPNTLNPDLEVVVDLDIQRRLREAGPSSWLEESTPSMRNIILDQLTQGAAREDAATTGLEIDAPVARALDMIKAINIARRRDAER